MAEQSHGRQTEQAFRRYWASKRTPIALCLSLVWLLAALLHGQHLLEVLAWGCDGHRQGRSWGSASEWLQGPTSCANGDAAAPAPQYQAPAASYGDVCSNLDGGTCPSSYLPRSRVQTCQAPAGYPCASTLFRRLTFLSVNWHHVLSSTARCASSQQLLSYYGLVMLAPVLHTAWIVGTLLLLAARHRGCRRCPQQAAAATAALLTSCTSSRAALRQATATPARSQAPSPPQQRMPASSSAPAPTGQAAAPVNIPTLQPLLYTAVVDVALVPA